MNKVSATEMQTEQNIAEGAKRSSSSQTKSITKVNKVMNIVLWILQVLLAAQFLFHGYIMIFPPAELVEIINAEFTTWVRLFIGIAESLGALGLLLPKITRIWPWLTSWASMGLMIVAISASGLHFSRGETSSAITTAVLFVLLAFVTYMRWEGMPSHASKKMNNAKTNDLIFQDGAASATQASD